MTRRPRERIRVLAGRLDVRGHARAVLAAQVGPPASLLAAFEPHLLALGAVCGALALLLTINERNAQASRIRVIAIAVIVVALVRVGGELVVARRQPRPRRALPDRDTAHDHELEPRDGVEVAARTWSTGILEIRQPLRPQSWRSRS